MSSPVCRASAVQIFGAGEYAMRIWLDPNKVAARGLTASDVVSAMQEQNVQVSAGQLGAEPMPTRSDYLLSINAGAACKPKKSSATSSSRAATTARSCGCATWRASKWAPAATRCAPAQ